MTLGAREPLPPTTEATFVVDASVAVKLFLDEPLAAQARTLFSRLAAPTPAVLHVPDLLYVECANILWKYVRRHGYDAETAAAHLDDLTALDLVSTPTAVLVTAALRLAAAEGITAYDACYVALADAAGAALVTADERLVNQLAGRHTNVVWLGQLPG